MIENILAFNFMLLGITIGVCAIILSLTVFEKSLNNDKIHLGLFFLGMFIIVAGFNITFTLLYCTHMFHEEGFKWLH